MGQRKRRGLGQLLVKSRDLEFNDWLARLLVSYSELTKSFKPCKTMALRESTHTADSDVFRQELSNRVA